LRTFDGGWPSLLQVGGSRAARAQQTITTRGAVARNERMTHHDTTAADSQFSTEANLNKNRLGHTHTAVHVIKQRGCQAEGALPCPKQFTKAYSHANHLVVTTRPVCAPVHWEGGAARGCSRCSRGSTGSAGALTTAVATGLAWVLNITRPRVNEARDEDPRLSQETPM
jgi:hypothetical protein